MAEWLLKKEGDYFLAIYLQPRASRDEVVAPYGECLKVRIKATPVNGKANQALIRYFARLFDVAKRDVTLLAGDTGRRKKICIKNACKLPAELREFL